MDDLIHLIATGGSGVSALATLALIWFVLDLRRELALLRTAQAEQGDLLARVDERTRIE